MDTQSVSSFVSRHLDDIGWAMLLTLLVIVAGSVLRRSVRARFGATPRLANLLQHAHRALAVVFLVAAARLALIRVQLSNAEWNDFLAHTLDILFIAALAWFICELISTTESFLILHYVKGRDHSDFRVRKVDTQVRLITHLSIALVIVIAIGLMLMSFPEVRIIGGSVIASAGIASVVAGLAAKTSLSNLFAGIQIAFSDSVRVGDIIQIGDQSGMVDEITLTYVVIDLWTEHRLTVPSEYFVSNQFQNWTRRGSETSALFVIDVDWTVPLDALEEAVREAITASGLWDKRSFGFKVKNITNGLITIRMVISTNTARNMFLLEAVVNRAVVDFVTSQPQGQGLPRTRVEGVGFQPLATQVVKDPALPHAADGGSLQRTIWEAATGVKPETMSAAVPSQEPSDVPAPDPNGSELPPLSTNTAAEVAEADAERSEQEDAKGQSPTST